MSVCNTPSQYTTVKIGKLTYFEYLPASNFHKEIVYIDDLLTLSNYYQQKQISQHSHQDNMSMMMLTNIMTDHRPIKIQWSTIRQELEITFS